MLNVSLSELFDIEVLQQIQDSFSKYTGLAAIMTDNEGVPITRGSGFSEFCTGLTRKSKLGLERCMECDKNGAYDTLKSGKPCVYKCHAGLCDFAAPLMLDDTVIGCLIGGQAAYEELDQDKVRATAAELGIDPEEYVRAAKKIKQMDMADIEKAAQFLFETAKSISTMAYRSFTILDRSRYLEREARIKAGYIVDNMTSDIKAGMEDWLMFSRRILENPENLSTEEMTRKLSEKSREVYTEISDTVEYLKESEQSADYEESTYNPVAFIEGMTETLRQICDEKNVRLAVNIDRSVPKSMFGNEKNVSYIIEKIVTNAARYAEGGTVTIDVYTEKSGYSRSFVIKVSDTGIGMNEGQLEEIRRHLYDQSAAVLGKSEANKMGYSVIGMLMRRMSGTITVDSEQGKGSVFIVKIPQLAVRGHDYYEL